MTCRSRVGGRAADGRMSTMPTFAAASKTLAGIGRRFYTAAGCWARAAISAPSSRRTVAAGDHAERRAQRAADRPASSSQIDGDGACRPHRTAPGAGARTRRGHRQRPRSTCSSPEARRGRRLAHALGLEHDTFRASRGGRRAGHRGYEMLKGLDGVATHEHREWIPIVAERSGHARLAGVVGGALTGASRRRTRCCSSGTACTPGAATIADAERHVEILEFLLEDDRHDDRKA